MFDFFKAVAKENCVKEINAGVYTVRNKLKRQAAPVHLSKN